MNTPGSFEYVPEDYFQPAGVGEYLSTGRRPGRLTWDVETARF